MADVSIEKIVEKAVEKSNSKSASDQRMTGALWERPGAIELGEYPRPQLFRPQWKSLNGKWRFRFDEERAFEHPSEIKDWASVIEVPFAPECKSSGIGDTSFHERLWYQRDFAVDQTSGLIQLHFEAVDYLAKVWVNHQYVGDHQGGFTPFSFDITNVVNRSGTNTLTVLAIDDPTDLAKPRGKQDWKLEPHSIWYPRTSGIWQMVWIEYVNTTYIDHVFWTPQLDRWEIGCEIFVEGQRRDHLSLRVRLFSQDQLLADDQYQVVKSEVHRRIALSDPGIDDFRNELLWSPETPNLIYAQIELWAGNQLLDRIDSYTALRSVAIQNSSFMLNGRPYYLRLILDQGYWGDSHMTPPSVDALILDIQLTKEMGFNGVRKHQKIEDRRYLYWADTLGLVVWEEMPSAYRFTHTSVERIMREWTEVIDRDFNHPCIIVWVPFNESWGVPDLAEKAAHRSCVKAMYHLTKTLDPTRPVVGNDGWESSATDIIGLHDYDTNPNRFVHRYGPQVKVPDLLTRRIPAGRLVTIEGYADSGQPLMLTEFGGIAYSKDPDRTHYWGYSKVHSEMELHSHYVELLKVVHTLELFSGFCYTQLADTFQEANGLLYSDRTPKFDIKLIRNATLGADAHPITLQVPALPPP